MHQSKQRFLADIHVEVPAFDDGPKPVEILLGGYETVVLFRKGSGGLAAIYALTSVGVGLLAVWLGRLLAASWIK